PHRLRHGRPVEYDVVVHEINPILLHSREAQGDRGAEAQRGLAVHELHGGKAFEDIAVTLAWRAVGHDDYLPRLGQVRERTLERGERLREELGRIALRNDHGEPRAMVRQRAG